MNAARMDKLIFGSGRSSWDVADSTIMRKQKWLLVKGCKHKRPISTKQGFFKLVTRWEKCISVFGDYGAK